MREGRRLGYAMVALVLPGCLFCVFVGFWSL